MRRRTDEEYEKLERQIKTLRWGLHVILDEVSPKHAKYCDRKVTYCNCWRSVAEEVLAYDGRPRRVQE